MCRSGDDEEVHCEGCATEECPIGNCESRNEASLLLRLLGLRKVGIYLPFDQSKKEKLVVLMDGENNRLLAERYKPSGQDAIVTVFDPVLKGGEIEFEIALRIEFGKAQKVVEVEPTTILYPK